MYLCCSAVRVAVVVIIVVVVTAFFRLLLLLLCVVPCGFYIIKRVVHAPQRCFKRNHERDSNLACERERRCRERAGLCDDSSSGTHTHTHTYTALANDFPGGFSAFSTRFSYLLASLITTLGCLSVCERERGRESELVRGRETERVALAPRRCDALHVA